MRVANKNARELVQKRQVFVGSNVFSEHRTGGWYVVYSYGYHFPMYAYNSNSECWFANSDKFSRSTTRQQYQMRPTVHAHPLNTKMLNDLISGRGT